MRFPFAIVFLLLSIGCCIAQSGLPLSRTYANTNGELSRSVWAITQDKRGIIYLATDRGVLEYDGVSFTALDTPPAYGIITDSLGIIYVSCKSEFGQLVTSPNGVVHFKSLFRFKVPVTKFEDVNMVISNRKVCAVSYNAAIEYDREKNSVQVYYSENGEILSNCFLNNDTLYVSAVGKGLRYLSNGKEFPAPYGDRFKTIHDGKMNTNLELPGGQRFVLFGPTILKYFGKVAPPVPFNLKGDYLKDAYIYSSFSLNEKEHMITTINKGAVLFDTTGAILNVYNKDRRLPGTAIPNGIKDHNGNLWFVFEFNKTPLVKTEIGQDISIWHEQSGIRGNIISVSQVKGQTHIATDLDLYAIDDNEKASNYFTNNTYSGSSWIEFNGVASTNRFVAARGDLFVGEYRESKLNFVHNSRDWCFISKSIYYPNRLYVIESDKFGYLSLTNNVWRYQEVARVSRYRSFVEDKSGVVWLTNENKDAMIRLVPPANESTKPISQDYFTFGKGMPEATCSPLLFGGKILFQAPKEIYTFNENKKIFEPWRGAGKKMRDLLLHATVIEKDTINDMLHLVSQNKLVSVAKDKNGDTLFIDKPYQRFENIGNIASLSVDRKGILWVAGPDGVIRYDRTKDKKNYDQEFNCLIRSVVLGKDSVLLGGGLAGQDQNSQKIKLDYDFDKLEITYAAPFFDKEEETLYSYQLIGRDEHWSDWEKVPSKQYNDLREGNYRFQVKAKNIYGKESSISSFSFTVRPPWFRVWWMYFFYVVGAALLITAIFRMRTQALQERRKELENLVKLRTNELVQLNRDLQSSHRQLVEANKELEASQEELKLGNEELGATNEYLKRMQKQMVDYEKMASLGQLTAGIAHEINNPINFISGGVQALQEIQMELLDGISEFTPEEAEQRKQDIKDLIKSINNGVVRTTSIIKSLKTFSSPIESIDENGSVDMKECVNDAATLVRSKLQNAKVNLIQNYNHTHGAKANASLISQVLINLFDNAIYALEKKTSERIIEVSTGETNQDIIVKVKDNAGGIPPDVLSHIFEPFFTTKEVGAGTGLGLWICYSIIEKHAGEISVVSEPGKGTEFTIMLPIGISL